MRVSHLRLQNFRNFTNAEISFDDKNNIFYGKNGQGKTNILESIYYSSLFKPFKGGKSENLIKQNSDFFNINIDYENETEFEQHNICINYQYSKKTILLDDKQLRSQQSHSLNFMTFFFSNNDLLLPGALSTERIKYFDLILSIISKEYRYILHRYQNVIKNRNLDLKNGNDPSKWNEPYFDYGTKIINARISFLKIINKKFSTIFSKLFNEQISVNIDYKIKEQNIINAESLSIEQFEKWTTKFRTLETIKKRTMFGPHRDDYFFHLNNLPLKEFGSQGQKRIFVYALKFTIYEYFKNTLHTNPILLLDDIFSDLDNQRIELFFNYLKNCGQTFLSSANYYILKDFISNFDLYLVNNNTITHGQFNRKYLKYS